MRACLCFFPQRGGVVKNRVAAGRGSLPENLFPKNFMGEEIPHSLQTLSSLLHDQHLRLDHERLTALAIQPEGCLRGWAAGWRWVPG